MLQMPQTIGMSDQSQSRQGSEVSPGKDQKSPTPVGHSNQKKTPAMVAKFHEDGEEAFTCMNVE